jgi:hypothetical protein
MKITGVTMMALAIGTRVWAGSVPVEKNQVTVCTTLSSDMGVDNQAQATATKIFAGIGVNIQWRGSASCPPEAIFITISDRTPDSFMPGALAYARPYERTHIVVFFDRVSHTAASSAVPFLLGHVIAHEVTHILQGIARHSDQGLMKPRWGSADYMAMAWKPLPLTDEDVKLIYSGLQRRHARASNAMIAAVNPAPVLGPQ